MKVCLNPSLSSRLPAGSHLPGGVCIFLAIMAMPGQVCFYALLYHWIVYLEVGESVKNAESLAVVIHHLVIRGENSPCCGVEWGIVDMDEVGLHFLSF